MKIATLKIKKYTFKMKINFGDVFSKMAALVSKIEKQFDETL